MRAGTFNISTAAAFVVAGAGVRVAKHGNRGLSSKCGSADVMEALGVKISLPTAVLATCLEEVGIVFLFAPAMHSAMKYVQPARRELRLRTIFNLLGPLTNPARASAQVVGVYSLDLVEKVAEALSMLGAHRALVVHGLDGLDEITITGPTRIAEVREGNVRTYEVTPEEFGINRAALKEISGGDAAANAAIIRDILAGKKSPRRDIVLLNAAAALVAAGKAEHLADGLPLAAQSIDSGAATAQAGCTGAVYNHSHLAIVILRKPLLSQRERKCAPEDLCIFLASKDLNTSVLRLLPFRKRNGNRTQDDNVSYFFAASFFNFSICSR